MSQVPESRESLVNKSFDEFTNTTVIEHLREIGFGGERKFDFRLKRVIGRDSDNVFFKFETRGYQWLFTERLVFVVDDENTDVAFTEFNSEVFPRFDMNGNPGCRESGAFVISTHFLKRICDCTSIKMRVYGRDTYHAVPEEWCISLRTYCRQFYNNVFNSSLYAESMLAAAPPQSGCFIATAALGSAEAPVVITLRRFRDDCLMTSVSGRRIVTVYYTVSPPIANLIRQHRWRRELVKYLFVVPAAACARVALYLMEKLRSSL
jgi:hypothetical protein